MSPTALIVGIALSLLAALVFIAVRGELDEEDPWSQFGEKHGLSRQTGGSNESQHVFRGSFRDRDLRIEPPAAGTDVLSVTVDLDLPVHIALSRVPEETDGVPPDLPVDFEAEGRRRLSEAPAPFRQTYRIAVGDEERFRRFVESDERAGRLVELFEAQPRLAVVGDRLHYRQASKTDHYDRRRIRRLVDRMVDTAAFIERGETRE